ncbi:hypothetical protein D9758_001416 [Tetrapyrgos nigripes]|uniref:Uncharacterized protein n=1 Tax=Tetrapyrgos nigripes TaxID=182062 RepID=A0A8H5GRT5_9AGAR|nr:hypothetical protein D9758_001416 [Tetrapyrgos nigripes]
MLPLNKAKDRFLETEELKILGKATRDSGLPKVPTKPNGMPFTKPTAFVPDKPRAAVLPVGPNAQTNANPASERGTP